MVTQWSNINLILLTVSYELLPLNSASEIGTIPLKWASNPYVV